MHSLNRLLFTTTLLICCTWLAPVQAEQPPAEAAAVSNVGIMPVRGMTMEEVERRFGPPQKRFPAVGKPPISRWKYDGFVVYFEEQYVIHALMTSE